MTGEPRAPSRFTILLAMLVLLLVGAPILKALEPEGLPRLTAIVTAVLFFAVLLSAVSAVARRGAAIVIALSLVGLIVVLWAVDQLVNAAWIAVVARTASAALLGFTITLMLHHLFTTDQVTWNTIAASLCIYLLLIVLWSNFYAIMALLDPSSFRLPPEYDTVAEVREFSGQSSAIALYYSLVTMTTLGYGDIVPLSPPARTLAGVQAVTGQLYIAVLIARLVGLHIAHSARVS
jgi:hypothetical protein